MNIKLLRYSLPVMLFSIGCQGRAQDIEIGTRGGASFNCGMDRFEQAEFFARADLPGRWNFWSDFWLQPKVEGSTGWLRGENQDAFIGTVGPMLELRKENFPLSLEGGSSPTLVSRDRFGDKDFGDCFQFTSHIDLDWHITKHLSIGYRFQHMSNAGIASPNPGLNIQMLSLSYHF